MPFPAIQQTMTAEQEMFHLKGRISQVYARREHLKHALESGALAPRTGFQQLEETDRELSELDSRYKTLWDASHGRCSAPTPVADNASASVHPAGRWAMDTTLDPAHLDCVTAVMLKILDGKCRMGGAEKSALTAVYDVVRDRPGQTLGTHVHVLIALARRGQETTSHAFVPAEIRDPIHALRIEAESRIPKPVMKGFKQWLRASLPMQTPD
jgi:hypothetical protein